MACNKVKGIRTAACSEEKTAHLMREHNDANIVSIGDRIISIETAYKIVDEFINTPFSNGERHIRRIKLLKDIEDEN